MSTIIHEYPVEVDWDGGRKGNGSVKAEHSGQAVNLAVPPEFMGVGGATNPEELLTSAICACYSMTFAIIAENRKLPVTKLHVNGVSQVEQTGANFVYKRVSVHPEITLASEATDDQVKLAEDMAHKADLYCIVTNAVRDKVEITIEPKVSRG